MESTIAIYQLIILYLLHRAPKELPMVLLSNFMLENGYVNFETLAATYEELKANGYVAAREEADGAVFLSITEEGNETLFFFRNQISDSIKRQADDYLQKNGYSLTTDQSVSGEYYKASFGGYTVHMCIRENKQILFELNLNVPTEKVARAVLKKWRTENESLYQTVIGRLF